ncbi:MarR family winged helix-turn-helix transcriptional regulator [Massilia sp. DWR3-1-1]|uniref:MarR family winged helix-turn-helix transcriptional regulator n=1 Tax=Massilia sp. DWR3-1-1 TaxID=2804559 RepID=UPI003CEAE28D
MTAIPSPPAAALADLQARFSAALHSTSRAWRLAIDQRLKDLGVSQAAWMTIAMVARSATPPSQKQLADLLGVEGPTVVAMVDRLVKAGLVLRVASPHDRRVKLIELTAPGQAMYAQVKQRADVFRADLLAQCDPAALLAASALLEQLQAALGAVADVQADASARAKP